MRVALPFILNALVMLSLGGGTPVAGSDGVTDSDRRLFNQPRSPITRMRDLEPVEQRVADVDPLGTSIRQIETGLRQPFGFEEVYRVPGDDEYFMRIDGGLYAVFPRSVYTNRRFGELPLIPANTVFSIGPPDFLLREAEPEPRNEAAEAMRRELAVTADSFRAPSPFISSELQIESTRIDSRYEDSSRDTQRRSTTRADQPEFGNERIDDRRRLQHRDDRLSRRRSVDAPTALEREQFRRRVHALLSRAAEAEAETETRGR